MKISIITPTFNSSKTINDTLASIQSQSYKNIEHIIIDGMSIDDTLEICRRESPSSIIISEPDNGIYDAMNKGINIASGDIIAILNSDDFYDNQFVIERVVESFNSNNSLDFIYGNLIYISSKDKNIKVREWVSESYYKNFFEDSKVPPHPTLFLKKEIYKKVGLFNLQYKLASDYDFMFRLFKLYNFNSLHINSNLVMMRLGGATSKNIRNIYKQNIEIYNCWINHGFNFPLSFFTKKVFNRISQFIRI